jgi:hypothetical protein
MVLPVEAILSKSADMVVGGVASNFFRDLDGDAICPDAIQRAIPGFMATRGPDGLKGGPIRLHHGFWERFLKQSISALNIPYDQQVGLLAAIALPLGRVTEMSVDSDGTTRWRGVLSGANPIARVVWNMLKEGMVHLGVSVGGKINGVRPGRDAIGRTCNLITDVRLDELSITDNPANRLIESETPDNGAYITALAKSVGNTMLAQKQQPYIYLDGIAYTAHPSEEHGIVLRKAGRRRAPSPGQLGLFGGHNEGDTKVEDGVTYRLNSNSRWERMDKPKASGKPSGGKKKAEKPAIVPVVEAEKRAETPAKAKAAKPKARRQKEPKPYLEDQSPSLLAAELDKIKNFLALADAGLVSITPRKRKQTEAYLKQVKDALFEITKPDDDAPSMSDNDLLQELGVAGMSDDDLMRELGVEPAAQNPEPTVGEMLEQQQAEIAESKPVISGRQFVEEFISAWNDTHGSEWNRDAAGYTKAKIWDKKDGEIRVYFGSVKQPLVFRKQDNGEYVAAVTPGKYGLDEQIAPILDDLNSRFSTKPESTKADQGSAGTQQRVLMQEDEDGVVAPAGQHERGVHIVREWYESEPSPKPTVGEMLEQQQAAIADEPMPESEAMEGAEDGAMPEDGAIATPANLKALVASLDLRRGDGTEIPELSKKLKSRLNQIISTAVKMDAVPEREFVEKINKKIEGAYKFFEKEVAGEIWQNNDGAYKRPFNDVIDAIVGWAKGTRMGESSQNYLAKIDADMVENRKLAREERLGLHLSGRDRALYRFNAEIKRDQALRRIDEEVAQRNQLNKTGTAMTIDNFLRKALGNPGREFGSGSWRDTGIPAMGRKVDAKSPQPKGGKKVQMDESGSAHAGKGIGGKQPKAHRPYSSGGMPPTDVFGITITQLTRNLAKACYMDKDAWGSPETVSFLTDSARAIAGMTDTPTDPMVNFVRFLQYCTRFAQELPFMNDYQAAGTVKAMNADLTKALDEFVEKMPEELKGKPLRPAGSPGVVGIDVQFPQQYVIYS